MSVIERTGDGPTTTTAALAGTGADAAEAVVEVSGLRMSYDGFEALRCIDLRVSRGEIFAFLGPNGAGKTTAVEILEGHRKRTAGDIKVLGEDPERADRWWRSRVGVVLQISRVEPQLSVRECLELYAGYYPAPRSVQDVIELVGLKNRSEVRCGQLSGGQQRRVDVALALIGDPELVFLDEPTTGFDPSARRSAWEMIEGLRQLGKTIFLTTHYMDEAEALADRIAVLKTPASPRSRYSAGSAATDRDRSEGLLWSGSISGAESVAFSPTRQRGESRNWRNWGRTLSGPGGPAFAFCEHCRAGLHVAAGDQKQSGRHAR